MRIQWAEGAFDDLVEIFERLSALSGEESAIRRVRRVQASINLLRTTPRMGRVSKVPGCLELVVPGTPHVVGYRLHESHVEIVGIRLGGVEFPSGGSWSL